MINQCDIEIPEMAVRFVILSGSYLGNTVQNVYTTTPFVIPGRRDKCRPLVVYLFIVSEMTKLVLNKGGKSRQLVNKRYCMLFT